MLQRRGLTEITEAWSYENNAVQIYPFIRLSENEGPTRALVWIYVLAIGILRVSRTWRTLEMRPPSQKILWTEKILLVLPFSNWFSLIYRHFVPLFPTPLSKRIARAKLHLGHNISDVMACNLAISKNCFGNIKSCFKLNLFSIPLTLHESVVKITHQSEWEKC